MLKNRWTVCFNLTWSSDVESSWYFNGTITSPWDGGSGALRFFVFTPSPSLKSEVTKGVDGPVDPDTPRLGLITWLARLYDGWAIRSSTLEAKSCWSPLRLSCEKDVCCSCWPEIAASCWPNSWLMADCWKSKFCAPPP